MAAKGKDDDIDGAAHLSRHVSISFSSLQSAEELVKDATDPNELAEAAAAQQAAAKGSTATQSVPLPVPASAVSNNPDACIQLAKLLAFSKVKKERRRGVAVFHQVFASGALVNAARARTMWSPRRINCLVRLPLSSPLPVSPAAGYNSSFSRFWAAMAHLESGEFRNARVLIEKLALEEPTNREAEGAIGFLKGRIEAEGAEGLKQMAIIAGVAIGAIGLGIWLWRSRSEGSGSSARIASEVASVVAAAAATAAPPPSLPTPAASSGHAGFSKPAYGARFKTQH